MSQTWGLAFKFWFTLRISFVEFSQNHEIYCNFSKCLTFWQSIALGERKGVIETNFEFNNWLSGKLKQILIFYVFDNGTELF